MDIYPRILQNTSAPSLVIDSFKFCQKNKRLEIYAYVIMSNHIHLLAKSAIDDLSGTIRDFKRHTSNQIIEGIQNNDESRKEWLLFVFKHAANQHNRNEIYQV